MQSAAAWWSAVRQLVAEAGIGPVADLALDRRMSCDFELDLALAVVVIGLETPFNNAIFSFI